MSNESIAAFTAYMQEQSDEITNQLNDFIGELILKIAPNNPIITFIL